MRSVQARLACVMFAAPSLVRSRAGHNRFAPGKRGQALVGSFSASPQVLSLGFVEALRA